MVNSWPPMLTSIAQHRIEAIESCFIPLRNHK